MSSLNGIQGLPIHEIPIAVIGFETTGFMPGLVQSLELFV